MDRHVFCKGTGRFKVNWVLFKLIFSVLNAANLTAPHPPVQSEYRHCVNEMVATREYWDRYIPLWLLVIDRRLYYLRDGIGVTESNLSWMDTWVREPNSGMKKAHLVSNALEDCRSYRSGYESYVRWSLMLIYSSLTTTLLIVLGIWFRPRRKPVQSDQLHKTQKAS